MNRISAFAILTLTLAGCGGGDGGDSSLMSSAGAVFGGGSHTCAEPVVSGSAEQVACHAEARAACPEGTVPSKVDFSQPTSGRYAGQFVVKGYSCA